MTKGPNRLNVLDFIISVLTRRLNELDRNMARLERVTRKLEKLGESQAFEEAARLCELPPIEDENKQKAEKRATCQRSL